MNVLKNYNNLLEQDKLNIQSEAGLPKWGSLYGIAGIATILMLVLIPVQIAVFTIYPTPGSATGWFQLFKDSWILGLAHLDILYIVNNTIVAVMYVAFYFSLRRKNEGWLLIALVTGLLATAAYYSSNPAFEMLSLSRQFFESSQGLERAALEGVGRALIAQWKGTSFDIYYILSAICLIIIAAVMFKSAIYGKIMAAIGLSSGILMLIPSSAGTLGRYFSLASLVPWVVFSIMAAKKFLNLSRISSMAPSGSVNIDKEVTL
ncbi:MAG: hypothetical protein BWY11_02313 [Firmicutes bacterium ADurb.Bin182]|nr:MAG: hypothetical protein BWY11_02313 [Firmicutes bacterium ADurb.Bin182]